MKKTLSSYTETFIRTELGPRDAGMRRGVIVGEREGGEIYKNLCITSPWFSPLMRRNWVGGWTQVKGEGIGIWHHAIRQGSGDQHSAETSADLECTYSCGSSMKSTYSSSLSSTWSSTPLHVLLSLLSLSNKLHFSVFKHFHLETEIKTSSPYIQRC